jgi:hypothetical protein
MAYLCHLLPLCRTAGLHGPHDGCLRLHDARTSGLDDVPVSCGAGSHGGDSPASALDVLNKRYAEGVIGEEEY